MIYEIEFTDKASADIELYKKSGQVNLLKKIAALIGKLPKPHLKEPENQNH
jgi:hypothetical protein